MKPVFTFLIILGVCAVLLASSLSIYFFVFRSNDTPPQDETSSAPSPSGGSSGGPSGSSGSGSGSSGSGSGSSGSGSGGNAPTNPSGGSPLTKPPGANPPAKKPSIDLANSRDNTPAKKTSGDNTPINPHASNPVKNSTNGEPEKTPTKPDEKVEPKMVLLTPAQLLKDMKMNSLPPMMLAPAILTLIEEAEAANSTFEMEQLKFELKLAPGKFLGVRVAVELKPATTSAALVSRVCEMLKLVFPAKYQCTNERTTEHLRRLLNKFTIGPNLNNLLWAQASRLALANIYNTYIHDWLRTDAERQTRMMRLLEEAPGTVTITKVLSSAPDRAVFLAEYLGQSVVMKRIQFLSPQMAHNQLVAMHRLKGQPSIVQLQAARFNSDNWTQMDLIMERLDGIDLEALITLRKEQAEWIPLRIVAGLMRQVVRAVEVMHAHQVLHLDLKPANLFILTDGRVKIIDFDGAILAPLTDKVTYFTPTMRPPEATLPNVQVGEAADIWTIGMIIVYIVLKGVTMPLAEVGMMSNYQRTRDWIQRLPTASAKEFVSRCLDLDATKRMAAKDLLNLPFLNAEAASDAETATWLAENIKKSN